MPPRGQDVALGDYGDESDVGFQHQVQAHNLEHAQVGSLVDRGQGQHGCSLLLVHFSQDVIEIVQALQT